MRKVTVITVGLLLLLGLTGCGSDLSDKSEIEILAMTEIAADQADETHLVGNFNGSQVNVHYGNGDSSAGSVVTAAGKFEFVMVGDKVYVRGGSVKQLLTRKQQRAKKWVKLPKNASTDGDSFRDLDGFMKNLIGGLSKSNDAVKIAGKTVNGTSTIGLETGQGKLYVANNSAQPYPLLFEGAIAKTKLEFRDWGVDYSIQPPLAKDVVLLRNTGN